MTFAAITSAFEEFSRPFIRGALRFRAVVSLDSDQLFIEAYAPGQPTAGRVSVSGKEIDAVRARPDPETVLSNLLTERLNELLVMPAVWEASVHDLRGLEPQAADIADELVAHVVVSVDGSSGKPRPGYGLWACATEDGARGQVRALNADESWLRHAGYLAAYLGRFVSEKRAAAT